MKAVERGEVDKVAAVLSKKGVIPTKLDVEGRSAWVNAHAHAVYWRRELNRGVSEALFASTNK